MLQNYIFIVTSTFLGASIGHILGNIIDVYDTPIFSKKNLVIFGGICFGIGVGLGYVVRHNMVNTYFSRYYVNNLLE